MTLMSDRNSHLRPIGVGRWAALLLMLLADTSACDAQYEVRVEKTDGSVTSGRLLSGSLKSIVIGDDPATARTIPTTELMTLTAVDVEKVTAPPLAGGPLIVLATGEQLRAIPTVIDDEHLVAQWKHFSALKPLQIPLEVCRGATLSQSADPFRLGIELQRLRSRTQSSDQLILRNADRIEGELKELSDLKFRMQTTLGEVVTALSSVQSIAMNPELLSVPKFTSSRATLVLMDGSVLQLRDVAIQRELLVARSISGISLELPVSVVRHLLFLGDSVVSLSDLKPTIAETRPFLAVRRNPQVDSNVLGGPLRVAGVPYGAGFGVMPDSTLSWGLQREYSAFQARVGVDDAASNSGSVEFEVLVDGESMWRSGIQKGSVTALRTPLIDLTGKSELTLRTHSSDMGTVKDFADWCHPVLIRRVRAKP